MPKIIDMEPDVPVYRARKRSGLHGLNDNLDSLKSAGDNLVANSGYILLGVLGALLVSHINDQDDFDDDPDEGDDV